MTSHSQAFAQALRRVLASLLPPSLRWREIDWDRPFLLVECRLTGERRTVIAARWIRHLYPGMRAKWEKTQNDKEQK